MIIALNVCDLDQANRGMGMLHLLLMDFCSETSPTDVNSPLMDEGKVILDGPACADQKRLTALVDLLQTSIGPRKIGRRIRAYYQNSAHGWTEIRPGTDWHTQAENAHSALRAQASKPYQLALI